MNEWISVKDRLPEYKNSYECFLVCDATEGAYAIARRESPGLKSGQIWCFSDDLWDDMFVTHWMPLPETPEVRELVDEIIDDLSQPTIVQAIIIEKVEK